MLGIRVHAETAFQSGMLHCVRCGVEDHGAGHSQLVEAEQSLHVLLIRAYAAPCMPSATYHRFWTAGVCLQYPLDAGARDEM
jgi:hypothetical protein